MLKKFQIFWIFNAHFPTRFIGFANHRAATGVLKSETMTRQRSRNLYTTKTFAHFWACFQPFYGVQTSKSSGFPMQSSASYKLSLQILFAKWWLEPLDRFFLIHICLHACQLYDGMVVTKSPGFCSFIYQGIKTHFLVWLTSFLCTLGSQGTWKCRYIHSLISSVINGKQAWTLELGCSHFSVTALQPNVEKSNFIYWCSLGCFIWLC